LTLTRTRGPEECLAGELSGLGTEGTDGWTDGESAGMDEFDVVGEDRRVPPGNREGRVGLTASSEFVRAVLECGRNVCEVVMKVSLWWVMDISKTMKRKEKGAAGEQTNDRK
jgi:hypothetical protein